MERRSLPLLAVAVILGGCGAAGGGTAPSPEAPAAATASSPIATPAPPTRNPPGLAPVACSAPAPARARCSTLWVPLDYAHPAEGTIPTAVMVLPATDPAHRLGALLVNPGGPGESGVQFVEDAAGLLSGLNRRFDLVGFDPRGTTGADSISCESTPGLDHDVGVDPMALGSPAREADLVSTSLAFADACHLHSGGLLSHVSTVDAARDMDALRAALGEARLTYLGFSYGTALGATYASLFPTHVRAMVLDGDIDPSISFLQQSVDQGASFEASYREFVRRCTVQPSCPLNLDPDAVLTRMLADLGARPQTAPDGRQVGRGLAVTALAAALYDPSQWGVASLAFAEAARGQVAALEALADALTGRGPGGFDHSLEANAAINCADHSVPETLSAYAGAAARVQGSEPHFGQDEVWSLLTCAYWPVHGPPASPLHVSGAPPILLVGATHDPATPYAWSQSLQQQIEGSVLLTRDGYGHTSYPSSACVRSAVGAYLVDLTLPAPGEVCPTD
jgi:pimeloyl-ACP methyl ester carboxylesterase